MLRRLLKQHHSNILIPPLPPKNNSLMDKVLQKRKKQFVRFLQTVCRSESLKHSSSLLYFLYMPSFEAWQNAAKKEEKKKYPGVDLTSIVNEEG